MLGWRRFFSPHGLRKLARMAFRSCIIFRLISFVDSSRSCQTPNACDRRRALLAVACSSAFILFEPSLFLSFFFLRGVYLSHLNRHQKVISITIISVSSLLALLAYKFLSPHHTFFALPEFDPTTMPVVQYVPGCLRTERAFASYSRPQLGKAARCCLT